MWIILRILIAVVLLFLLQLYFYKKASSAVKTLWPEIPIIKTKTILYFFLFLLNLYPLLLIINSVYAVITGQSILFPQNTIMDYLVIFPFWIILLIIVQTIIVFLLFDLLKIILYPVYKKYRIRIISFQAKLFFVVIIFFIIYVPVRVIYDFHSIDIREVEFVKENLPDDLKGFRITLIADLQADRYTNERRLSNYIDAVNSTNSDLVLIAGDVITSSPNYIETAAKFIGNIKSKYGVYSCVGDHDNWAYRRDTRRSIREIGEALRKYDVEMVDNDVRNLEINSASIGITFITNTYVETISRELLSEVSNKNYNDFKILLTHQPQKFLINSAMKNGYDLFLAGHTHGGQITFLLPFIKLSPTLIETKYVKGDFYFNDMLAIVNGGLGMSISPVRYNSTPEVVSITLKAK
ncbi:MAG: metallophosphoesterase [Ignavibacterium sp.]|nr:metallophosphoesterase [Ignavibacterium sp.]